MFSLCAEQLAGPLPKQSGENEDLLLSFLFFFFFSSFFSYFSFVAAWTGFLRECARVSGLVPQELMFVSAALG